MAQIRIKENEDKAIKLCKMINATVAKYERFTNVEVILYGTIRTYWSEEQVRAFQILAHNADEISFAYLKKNVVIYSGPKKKHKMKLRSDGKFENSFERGFYDANSNIAFEIF